MPYTGIQKRYKGNEVLNHALSLVRPSPSIPWPKGRVYHTMLNKVALFKMAAQMLP